MTAKDIEKDIIKLHGYVIGNEDLSALLGFKTMGAFRQAISRKKVPIKIFNIENRRGKFALAKDVAQWLFKQRLTAE
ncbi:hypothetical protein [Kangiella sp. TOML190]|uniref:hypothetical protein n=1 Tax=Kangiella sp. TOML190 TaxID=2931351 RepID=UPI0020423A8D|nr:hypothetical protein [Kangiella sp. TOML190]